MSSSMLVLTSSIAHVRRGCSTQVRGEEGRGRDAEEHDGARLQTCARRSAVKGFYEILFDLYSPTCLLRASENIIL